MNYFLWRLRYIFWSETKLMAKGFDMFDLHKSGIHNNQESNPEVIKAGEWLNHFWHWYDKRAS